MPPPPGTVRTSPEPTGTLGTSWPSSPLEPHLPHGGRKPVAIWDPVATLLHASSHSSTCLQLALWKPDKCWHKQVPLHSMQYEGPSATSTSVCRPAYPCPPRPLCASSAAWWAARGTHRTDIRTPEWRTAPASRRTRREILQMGELRDSRRK